ncbi:hypothetical protein HKCCE4037_06660 [Rhodobacterales bacterium HKCCE4037]|nr:hypothetical protein [Rhodobacterales bacterium HKCCE4037]
MAVPFAKVAAFYGAARGTASIRALWLLAERHGVRQQDEPVGYCRWQLHRGPP